ncbi:hypothetical protein QQ045_020625 [Rhodiola kirilowii]
MKKKCKRRCKRQHERKSIIDYLPEDVLYQIFTHLDEIDLKSTYLVCRLFRSLSSSLVRKLTLKDSSLTYSQLQRLFKRFPDVKNICIYRGFHELVDNVLLEISESDLNLEKLKLPLLENSMNRQNLEAPTIDIMSISRVIKGIKSLHLGWFDTSATKLQNLNICYRWKDKLIHKVTSKLPNLRKISLAYNYVATDKTLVILSTNCPKLESVDFRWCKKFTPEALYTFFCNHPQLSSVGMPEFQSSTFYKVSKVMVQCMQVLKNLNHLSLDSDHLEDAVLIELAESPPPLKSLAIHHSFSQMYTMVGLSRLLSTCPSLESLDIFLPHRKPQNCTTQDAEMSTVVNRLPNLKHIAVRSRVVCRATLFSLIHNCPLLERIWLMSDSHPTELSNDQSMVRPAKKNYSIKSIEISPKDSKIQLWPMVKTCCPNLK